MSYKVPTGHTIYRYTQSELLNKEYGETLGYLLQRNCAENINGDLPSTTTKQVEHRKPQQQNRRKYGYY